jgi:hypothetical protein
MGGDKYVVKITLVWPGFAGGMAGFCDLCSMRNRGSWAAFILRSQAQQHLI